jgi:hypothetical protein
VHGGGGGGGDGGAVFWLVVFWLAVFALVVCTDCADVVTDGGAPLLKVFDADDGLIGLDGAVEEGPAAADPGAGGGDGVIVAVVGLVRLLRLAAVDDVAPDTPPVCPALLWNC